MKKGRKERERESLTGYWGSETERKENGREGGKSRVTYFLRKSKNERLLLYLHHEGCKARERKVRGLLSTQKSEKEEKGAREET